MFRFSSRTAATRAGVALLVTLSGVSACGSDAPSYAYTKVDVSMTCADAVALAAGPFKSWGRQQALVDAALVDSLAACASVDEWLTALKARPDIVGVTDSKGVDLDVVRVYCAKAKAHATVCEDAKRSGLL